MPRKSPFRIDLSVDEATELRRRAAKYTLPYFEVVRAKMILMAADGIDNDEIAARLVDRSVNMLTNHATSRSNFFQRNTTGAAFISSMPLRMRALSSGIEATRIWRRKVRAIFEKVHSMRLSQEPCLGV